MTELLHLNHRCTARCMSDKTQVRTLSLQVSLGPCFIKHYKTRIDKKLNNFHLLSIVTIVPPSILKYNNLRSNSKTSCTSLYKIII